MPAAELHVLPGADHRFAARGGTLPGSAELDAEARRVAVDWLNGLR